MVETHKTAEYLIREYQVRDAEPVPLRFGRGQTIIPRQVRVTFLNGKWMELHLRSQVGDNERSVILTADDQPLPVWLKPLTRFEED